MEINKPITCGAIYLSSVIAIITIAVIVALSTITSITILITGISAMLVGAISLAFTLTDVWTTPFFQ